MALSSTTTLRVAERVSRLGGEGALDVLVQARRLEAAGREVVHLEIGEPDFPTAPHVIEAGLRALRDGATRYGPPAGLPELREAIAEAARARGLTANPENVLVTSGAKPMLHYALVALIEPGDEVLVPDPGFPIIDSIVRFAGGVPVRYRVDPLRREAIELDEIAARITPKTRVLVLNSPHNPTGSMVSPKTLVDLGYLVLRHDLAVISDEIYSRLVFDGHQPSIAALPGLAARTIVIDGFSKTYCMTGWRLGYGIVPTSIVPAIERLIVNTTTCAPPFVQHAGVAALRGPQEPVDHMREELRSRRDLLVGGLNRIPGIRCATPRGAFYAFPNVSGLLEERGVDTNTLATTLLEELGVACLSGTAFGEGGAGYLRLSFATAPATLLRALERLQEAAPAGLRAEDV